MLVDDCEDRTWGIIKMRILQYLGWEECSFFDYKEIAIKYGHNAESSPFYIDFLIRQGAELKFFNFKKKHEIYGGCCVDNGWLLNDAKNPKSQTSDIPIPRYSITLPFKKKTNCIIPFKSKHFSQGNDLNTNVSFRFLSSRHIAISKKSSDFKPKTISTRNREMRKFLEDGGRFINSSEYNVDELYSIYSELYSKRRPGKKAFTKIGKNFFYAFRDNIVGDIALINGEPVAFQCNLSTSSCAGLFIDFINIGYDISVKKHSLGTLIMWQNLKLIEYLSQYNNLPLIYSYGMMSGDYKHRWCISQRVGKILTL